MSREFLLFQGIGFRKMGFTDVLTENGYATWSVDSYENFLSLCSSLGEIINITDVAVDKNKGGLLVSSHGMGLHTDDPRANFVAWWCKSPATSGGETVLADAWKAFTDFSEVEIDLLKSILVRVPQLDISLEPIKSRPILIGDRDIYFANWLLIRESQFLSPEISKVLEKIRSFTVFKRRLEASESLFINNKRILHGRAAFTNDDKASRALVRVWIKTAPK